MTSGSALCASRVHRFRVRFRVSDIAPESVPAL